MKSKIGGFIKEYKDQEKISEILLKNSLNTYVMSCYADKDHLFSQMRNDIKILCEYIKHNN